MGEIEIGRIVRLQLQTASLKRSAGRDKWYDPAPLAAVDELWLTAGGPAAEIDGVRTLDVHHAEHPASKNVGGKNPISIGFTVSYARMRERFGAHLSDGIAGENILVETAVPVSLDELAGGIAIVGDDGRSVTCSAVRVAHPCVEFSRFAMADPRADPRAVSETLRFLDDGVRGYYLRVESAEPLRVALGDRVLRLV